jgi:Tol biopolymer transport system component
MRLPSFQRLLAAVMAVLLTAAYAAAQKEADFENRFRDALHKEQADGDLNGAITIYRAIIASPSASRSVKARALLQLGGSMETLGQQAESVYERIVREFEDQPVAAQARTKLASMKPAPSRAMTLTLVKFALGIRHVEATDGQRVVYWNDGRTILFIGDVAGKTKTQIFAATPLRRPRVEVSRDLSRVFLYFAPSERKREVSYAVIKTDGSGAYHEVSLPERGTPGSLVLSGVSWSFDNRYVFLCKQAEDRIVHLLRLSVDDGQIVDLTPGQGTSVMNAVASPNGRSIALTDATGVLSIMRAEGGPLETIAPAGGVADWTIDGRYLIFDSVEKNVFSLFAVPVKEGRAAGDRILIRQIGGEQFFRPVTLGSSLVYMQSSGRPDRPRIYHASLDQNGHLNAWTTLNTRGTGFRSNPAWSPDGTQFTYISRELNDRSSTVRVYSFVTNQDRELFRTDNLIINCLWASQPPVIYCSQVRQADGKTDILSLDVTTGRPQTLASFDGSRTLRALTPDDSVLMMYNPLGPTALPRWKIGTDQEIPGTELNDGFFTPDDRWFIKPTSDKDNRREFQIRPNPGGDGDLRHLAYLRKQAPDPRGPIPRAVTHDGNWLVYQDLDADGKDSLVRVSLKGGEPEIIGDYPTSATNGHLQVSRDGQQFLLNAAPGRLAAPDDIEPEVWLLQNFIPTASAAR